MTSYRLMDGAAGRPGVGSTGTQPPSSASAYAGPWMAGITWEVTQNGMWLEGYWWWVANTGQDTIPAKFALWQVFTGTTGLLVPGSVVTSGTLTAGQWNYVPLPAPVQLSGNAGYMAAVGYTAALGFPYTGNQFGSGQPYVAGITNGPLFAWGNGAWQSVAQCAFSQSSADPAAAMPTTFSNNFNGWIDPQVRDTPPAGYAGSYRLWPSQPHPMNSINDTATNFTLATEFTLSKSAALNKIWFYSPPGVTQLPTECGIWQVSNQSLVAGTHVTSPSWSGAAGSGWISCSFAGVTLPAGDYKVSVLNAAASPAVWNATTYPYWESGHPGNGGITWGPLTAPDTAHATPPGQSTYNQGTAFVYPNTYSGGSGSQSYWVDVEVTPAASGSGLLVAAFP